jgi:hypothetical protein
MLCESLCKKHLYAKRPLLVLKGTPPTGGASVAPYGGLKGRDTYGVA